MNTHTVPESNPAEAKQPAATAYEVIRKALLNIAEGADEHCGCDFPCQCKSESAEAWRAGDMRGVAAEALAATPPVGAREWISVDERLPDDGAKVLISGPAYGHYTRGRFTAVAMLRGGKFVDDNDGDDDDVTYIYPSHWMQLPPDPDMPAASKCAPEDDAVPSDDATDAILNAQIQGANDYENGILTPDPSIVGTPDLLAAWEHGQRIGDGIAMLIDCLDNSAVNGEPLVTYAHIYNAPKGQFRLILTSGPAISEGVLSEVIVDSRAEVKAQAKAAGAKPHNY